MIDPEKISKVYKLGSEVEAVKIVGYQLVDGWASGSNLRSAVSG